ncbi:MAG: sigma factor [Anaeromyxobacteraceae bacterium]
MLLPHIQTLLASGDARGAATAVIEALGPTVLSYLRPVLRDEDDVKDAFSIWAENVWKGLPGFEGRSSLKTWCLRLACNVVLNLKNQAHARKVRRFETGEASRLAESLRTASAVKVERRRQRVLELRKLLTPDEQTLPLPARRPGALLGRDRGRPRGGGQPGDGGDARETLRAAQGAPQQARPRAGAARVSRGSPERGPVKVDPMRCPGR